MNGNGGGGARDGGSEGGRPTPRPYQMLYYEDPETLELVPVESLLCLYSGLFGSGEFPPDEGFLRPHSVIDDPLSRQLQMLNIGNGAGEGASTSGPDCGTYRLTPRSPLNASSVYSPGLQSPVLRHRHRGEYHQPNGTGRFFHDSAGEMDETISTRPNGRNYSLRFLSTLPNHRTHEHHPSEMTLSLDSMNSNFRHSGNSRRASSLQVTVYPSLSSLRGTILDLASDRECCKVLQRTIEQGLDEVEVEILFQEIKDHLVDLMTHRYANYIVQQFLEICSEKQRNFVVFELTAGPAPPIVHIAFDQQGTRVVQKLLDSANTQLQRYLLSRAIFPNAVELSKSPHGQHVILHCFENFSDEDNEFLYSEVANNCCDISIDKFGCCVIQKCVESARGNQRKMLVDAITAEAYYLSKSDYGNYVVQHIVKLKIPGAIPGLISQLKGKFLFLCCDKFASNVVECCLKESGREQFAKIVADLLSDQNCMAVFLDQYGNYVFTTAVEFSKKKGVDYIFHTLQAIIQQNAHIMSGHFYGSKALARLEKKKLLLPETVASLRCF